MDSTTLTERTNPLPPVPGNIIQFSAMFQDDVACATYLEQVRWPDGFVCPRCSLPGEPYRLETRPGKLECRHCRYQASLTAGTMMHQSHMPLRDWFWTAYLVSTQTPGVSALQIKKQVGFKRYETAYMMLRKLRAGMSRPGQDKIGGQHPVELDVTHIGGATKGLGKGRTLKMPVIVAVEYREGKPPTDIHEKRKQRFFAGRVRLRTLNNQTAQSVNRFVNDWIVPGSTIRSDEGTNFTDICLLGMDHQSRVIGRNKALLDTWMPLSSLVISNLKAWLLGTFHGAVRKKHLQEYLNEYMFRFNRRFWSMSAFRALLQIGTQVDAVTYRDHYDGLAHVRENMSILPEDLGYPEPGDDSQEKLLSLGDENGFLIKP